MADATEIGITETSCLLGLHANSVRALADAGDLPHRRTAGGHRRFTEADVLAYREGQMKRLPQDAAAAAIWTAAALAVLRNAESALGLDSPLAAPFQAAARELHGA